MIEVEQEYETIVESSLPQIFSTDFQNSVQFLVSECIGSIAANYSVRLNFICLSQS